MSKLEKRKLYEFSYIKKILLGDNFLFDIKRHNIKNYNVFILEKNSLFKKLKCLKGPIILNNNIDSIVIEGVEYKDESSDDLTNKIKKFNIKNIKLVRKINKNLYDPEIYITDNIFKLLDNPFNNKYKLFKKLDKIDEFGYPIIITLKSYPLDFTKHETDFIDLIIYINENEISSENYYKTIELIKNNKNNNEIKKLFLEKYVHIGIRIVTESGYYMNTYFIDEEKTIIDQTKMFNEDSFLINLSKETKINLIYLLNLILSWEIEFASVSIAYKFYNSIIKKIEFYKNKKI